MKFGKMICYALGAFWLGIILACGGSHATVRGESSPAVSQDLWERCYNPVISTQCGPSYSGDTMYRAICGNRLANGYFALQSLAERQQYLVHNGCPPAMVH